MTDTEIIQSPSSAASHKTQENQILQKKSNLFLALEDLKAGLANWHVWLFLSWQDIRLNYRRSVLGPFWITMSMAVSIYTTGFLYSKLFHMDLKTYYPYLATGILSWALISALIVEGTNTFIEAENFIKQMKQPYSTFVFRVVTRLTIVYFHNLIVLLPIYLFLQISVNKSIILMPLILFVIWINGVTYSMLLSLLSTRFRDFKPVITSLMQVIFFLTPVLWMKRNLPESFAYLMAFNPFAHFLDLMRAPLLGELPSMQTLQVVGSITIIGIISSFFAFARYRARITYWL